MMNSRCRGIQVRRWGSLMLILDTGRNCCWRVVMKVKDLEGELVVARVEVMIMR